jgi:hypothetical protein
MWLAESLEDRLRQSNRPEATSESDIDGVNTHGNCKEGSGQEGRPGR